MFIIYILNNLASLELAPLAVNLFCNNYRQMQLMAYYLMQWYLLKKPEANLITSGLRLRF